jgi:hypothetical protein
MMDLRWETDEEPIEEETKVAAIKPADRIFVPKSAAAT